MMEVPHFHIFITETTLVERAKEILAVLHEDWDLASTTFRFFTKGITNTLLGCYNSDHVNEVILIRVYGNKSDMLIDRGTEVENIKHLHAAGFAPKVHATFENGLVYEYVPGETLNLKTCRLENFGVLVARKLADMHCIQINSDPKESVLWERLRKFMSLVTPKFTDKKNQIRFHDFFPQGLDLETEYSFLEHHLKGTNNKVVFCHNDLLLANIIYNSEKNEVFFIDYEYSGYNYQAFDIANHFNEYAGVDDCDYSLFPGDEYQKLWIRFYLERYKMNLEVEGEDAQVTAEEVESLHSEVQKFTLASHYLWGVWSLIQVEYSLISFDFLNYAFVRFREYYNRKKKIFSC